MILRSAPRRAASAVLTGISALMVIACSGPPAGPSVDAGRASDGTSTTPRSDRGEASSSRDDAEVGLDSTAGGDAPGRPSDSGDGSSPSTASHEASVKAGAAGDATTPRDALVAASEVGASQDAPAGIPDALEADAVIAPDSGAPDGPIPDAHGASSAPPVDAGAVAPDAHRDASGSVDAGLDAGPPALGYVGRIDWSQAAGPRFEWSGTQVIIRFDGTGVTIQMADYGNYFDVYIDGALQPDPIMGTGGNGTLDYVLASGLVSGTHEVILYRRTEAEVSLTQILGVTFPPGGALLPPPRRPDRRIEIVGDSISCGLGVLGVGPTCTPTNLNEDHGESYGAITARALGADLITVAWSGKGMYEDYGGATTGTMPDLYPYSMPTQPSATTLWIFSTWTPDAVVINLGTNDFWNGDPGAGFEQTYLAFVQTVRAHYPSAYIVCANGPLLLGPDFAIAEEYISGVVSQMQAAGDTRIAYLSFGMQGSANGYGCDYHPSPATHAVMATALEAALASALGW